jgi:hypothetical protein
MVRMGKNSLSRNTEYVGLEVKNDYERWSTEKD